MSAERGTTDSDDEFEDAVSDPTIVAGSSNTSQAYQEAIDELTKKQSELKLPDEIEELLEGKEIADEAAADLGPEIIDDMIDEDTLREAEKDMSEEELLCNKLEADNMKLKGNELFKNNDAVSAVEIYSEALKLCPTPYTKERAVLYGNRAAAKISLDSKKSAIEDCTKAIELWPDYVRAILRRAKLYELEDKLDDALEDYKRVYELDPGQQEARSAMTRLPPIINERNERMKAEMMGKLKDLGNMILKPFGLSTANFQMQQDPNSGSYSVNFNQNSS